MTRCGNPAIPKRNRVSCFRTSRKKLKSLKEIVDAYIREWRPCALREMQSFRNCRKFAEAIERASLSTKENGKRHPHQCRIPGVVLAEAARNLTAASSRLSKCRSFESLHGVIKEEIGAIRGLGPLTVYDIATRIGAYRDLHLEPEMIYLHAGTAKGAKALGFHGRKTLNPRELPREFWVLKPREIEDCLCLYEEDLFALRS